MKVLKAADVKERKGSGYPSPFNEPCMERSNRSLGDEFGLADFGVQLTTLEPGTWSSQRHWHSSEDEFIYVLEGEPTLVTDEGETVMAPGDIAGFPAGVANGHHLINRSDRTAKFLVVGSRKADDDAFYPDIDMQILKGNAGGVYTRRDGTSYPERSKNG